MSAGVCTTSPSSGWLRRASNGSLRASKASLSVLASGSALATIDERETIPTPGLTHQALGARATLCFSKPDVHPTMVDHSGLPTPTTPGRRRFVHPGPIGVSEARSDSESDDGGVDSGFGFRVVEQGGQVPVSSCGLADACMPSSPSSSRYTSTSDDSGVQIVRAHRIHTARARAHSIDEVIGKRQLLSPPPDQIHSLPPPLGLTEAEAINYGLSTPRISPRSFVPAPASPLSPAFRQRIIPNLLEHINEDDAESHSSHASSLSATRSVRSASIPTTKHSLPPPPRPRNKALIRPSQSQSLPCTPLPPDNSDLTRIQKSELAPALAPPAPHRPSRSTPRRGPPSLAIPPPPSSRDSTEVKSRHSSASLHSLPLSPAVPASAATPAFPQSPHSTVFFTCSEPISPQRSTFLPSCRATSIDSGTFQEDPSSPRQSKDRRDSAYRTYRTSALSTLSNPFGEFSFLKPYAKHRTSGVSFASNVSGSSARCATEAESIPIGLHRPSHECEQEYLPISPRSSVFGIDIDTTSPSDDDTESVVTEEESKKSSVFVRGRAKSLNLPRVPVASLNKVDRILGLGASHALINRHVHVPHLSISTMSSEDAPVEPAQQSFLPSAGPPSAFSMGNLGRKLSKKSTSTERRRSEDVQRSSSANSGRLMARVGEFIGRTPSPGGRARDLDSEDESPSPPPIPTFPQPTHRRKHSSSDPSSGLAPILNDRPSTTNIRTAAERAEMIKKTRKIQQLLGDIPSSGEASTFYKIPRAARSEDSVPSLVVPGASEEVKRGYHRSTASLSSRPLLSLSPGLTSPAFPISATTDDFGLGLISPSASSPLAAAQPLEGEPEHEEDAAEDETTLARRAKRAKVAKLHRYLGSRVPAHLVLGLDDKWDYEQGLPEVRSEDEGASGSGLIPGRKKRRASDGDYALLDETMGDLSVMSVEEKARAVRRKAKMEKMFGENPPQRLYQPQGDAAKNDAEEALEDDSDRGAHYRSYRASFNSLAYFVDNADRDSLEGLYDIISNPTGPDDDEDEEEARNQFEVRRKRAAKLSDFFGVSYRDLFGAVLDVLENDVREDKEQGSLSAIETQDLLMKLRRLKAKGEKIHI